MLRRLAPRPYRFAAARALQVCSLGNTAMHRAMVNGRSRAICYEVRSKGYGTMTRTRSQRWICARRISDGGVWPWRDSNVCYRGAAPLQVPRSSVAHDSPGAADARATAGAGPL